MKRTLSLLSVLVSVVCFSQQPMFNKQGHGNRVVVIPPTNPNAFTFTIASDFTTSAGVFKSDGTLVRTLWGNEAMKSGTYTKAWDKKDDLGNTVADGNYHIELLRSNVQYNWDGVIGNTSTNKTGNYVDITRTLSTIKDMAITGTKMFYCNGWYETTATNYVKSTTDLGAAAIPVEGRLAIVEPATFYNTTDGINVYWYGQDTHNGGTSWIWANKVSDNSRVTFQYGVFAQEPGVNNSYASAIDYRVIPETDNIYVIKGGLSVQTNGNFLFMGRGNNDILSIIHKTTGQLMSTVSMTGITAVATDLSNGLWIAQGNTVTKYTVDASTGAITNTGLTLSGLSYVKYMKITPDGTTLAVIDGGVNQQVKGFNNTTGTLTRTLGQQGGYQTNATVANNKFAFQTWPIIPTDGVREYADQDYPFLSFEPSGKIWIGDVKNQRYLRYSADWNTYETQMAMQGATLWTQIHPTDNTRVFAGGSESVEFAVDYTKPLDNGVNGSWRLSYNWMASLPRYYDRGYDVYQSMVQLSGRTYTTVVNRKLGRQELFEMVSGGTLRNTGIYWTGVSKILNDGTLIQVKDVTPPNPYKWYKKALVSIDVNNNPNWGIASPLNITEGAGTEFSSIAKDDLDPFYTAQSDVSPITATNKLITFKGDPTKGYHLGGIKLKTDGTVATDFLWKTSPSTRPNYVGWYPTDGTFDIGNNVIHAGGDCKVFNGNNILYNYHGEFWKGTQTNYFLHYWENGLPISRFGERGSGSEFQAAAGLAGNVIQFGIVKFNDDVAYLYHGDEFTHSAIHRWSITGLSSIKVDTIPLGTTSLVPAIEGIDLMAGLNPTYTPNDTYSKPVTDFLPSGQYGWLQSPATNDGTQWINAGSTWRAIIGTMSYDKRKPTDIAIHYEIQPDYSNYNGTAASIPVLSRTVTRDLTVDAEHNTTYNTTGLTSWKLWGNIHWDNTTPNNGANTSQGGGQFVEVLDNNGKVITRIYPLNNGNNTVSIMANTTAIRTATYNNVVSYASEFRPVEITVDNTGATYKYGEYPSVHTTIVDPTANWQNPKTLRFYFWTWNDGGGRTVGATNMRFVVNPGTNPTTTTSSTSPPVYVPDDKIIPIPVGKTAYYISNSGSVSNSGTDSLHPWPLSKIQGYTTLPNGIAVLFHRGETFTGTMASGSTFYPTVAFYSNTSANPTDSVIYDAYGAGAKPILTPMNTFPGSTIAGNWRQVAGLTNVWVINLPVLLNYTPRMWLNGVEYQRAKDSTQVNATKRTCFRNADFEMMYVYSPGGNPATAYSSIKSASFSKTTLDIGGQNLVVVRNIEVDGSEGASLDLTLNKNVLVENCIIGRNGNREGMRNNGVSDIVVRNNLFTTGEINKQDFNIATEGGDGMIFGQNGARNVEAYNNYYENYRHVGYSIECDTPTDSVVNVRYHHNYVTAPNIDYGRGFAVYYYKGLNVKMDHNTYRNIPIQNQLAADGFVDEYNRYDSIRNNTYMDFGTGGALSIGHSYFTAKNMTIQYDTVTNCESFGVELVAPKQGATGTDVSFCTFRGNVLQNNGYNNLATITAPEYYPQNTDFIIRESPTGQSHVYIHDNNYLNNNFNRSNPEPPIYYAQAANGTILNTVSQFQTNLTNADVATGNLVNTAYNYPIVPNTTYVPAIFNIELKSTDKWVDDGTGGYTSTDGTQGYATSRNNASYSTPFELLATYTGAINQGAYVGFDSFWNLVGYFGWAFAVEVDATGRYYAQNNAANETSTGVVAQAGDLYGLRKYEDGTIVAGYYRSGTWAILKTFSLKLNNVTCYAKVHTLAGKKLQSPKLRRERSNFGSRTVFNIGSLP